MAKRNRERSDSAIVVHKTVKPCALLQRLVGYLTHNNKSTRQHLQMIAGTTELLHATFYVGVESTRVGDIAPSRKDDFCRLGSKLAARFRRTSLHDDRPTLNGSRNVEWPAHFQELSLMIQNVKLVRIKIDARFHVANESVVCPTVPETRHHVEELPRAAIACLMLNMFLETEIHRLMWIAGSHNVPARAPSTDMIERGEFPRNMIRIVISRRGGGDEPEMFSNDSERRQQRQWIERGRRSATLE